MRTLSHRVRTLKCADHGTQRDSQRASRPVRRSARNNPPRQPARCGSFGLAARVSSGATSDCSVAPFPSPAIILAACSAAEAIGTQWLEPRDAKHRGRLVPAGYMSPGVAASVVHEFGGPAAEGEVGELVLSGEFVAPGTWDRRPLPPLGSRRGRAHRSELTKPPGRPPAMHPMTNSLDFCKTISGRSPRISFSSSGRNEDDSPPRQGSGMLTQPRRG
jgi:acyl-CoA synthetase (AMP-forming)/AMP-acid ligase II